MIRPRIDNQAAAPPPAAPVRIGPADHAAIRAVRLFATAHPITEAGLADAASNPAARVRFRQRLASHRVELAGGLVATFTVEILSPAADGDGSTRTCRQATVKLRSGKAVPTPRDVWHIAEAFGFVGGLDCCDLDAVDMASGGAGISIAQPLICPAGRA